MKKVLSIIACAMIPVLSAQAEGNTNEAQTLNILNSTVGMPVFRQSNTLPQPSRRDVAGAVVLDLEQENTVEDNSVELNKE